MKANRRLMRSNENTEGWSRQKPADSSEWRRDGGEEERDDRQPQTRGRSSHLSVWRTDERKVSDGENNRRTAEPSSQAGVEQQQIKRWQAHFQLFVCATARRVFAFTFVSTCRSAQEANGACYGQCAPSEEEPQTSAFPSAFKREVRLCALQSSDHHCRWGEEGSTLVWSQLQAEHQTHYLNVSRKSKVFSPTLFKGQSNVSH